MSIDLEATLRKRKPAKHAAHLVSRPDSSLVDLAALPTSPLFLLLDTNVYIDRAAGRLPAHVINAIDQALLFHCSVALAELAVGIANADPSLTGWTKMQDHYAEMFARIPPSRLKTPDAQIWCDAGVIAGMLARTQKFQPYQRKDCLNDALIFLTAAKAGIPMLTANRNDFDLIQQIAPDGKFIYY